MREMDGIISLILFGSIKKELSFATQNLTQGSGECARAAVQAVVSTIRMGERSSIRLLYATGFEQYNN